jgi:hypothetical protein
MYIKLLILHSFFALSPAASRGLREFAHLVASYVRYTLTFHSESGFHRWNSKPTVPVLRLIEQLLGLFHSKELVKV